MSCIWFWPFWWIKILDSRILSYFLGPIYSLSTEDDKAWYLNEVYGLPECYINFAF